MNKWIPVFFVMAMISFSGGEPLPEQVIPVFEVKLPNPGHWIERFEKAAQLSPSSPPSSPLENPRLLSKETFLVGESRKDLLKWSDGSETEQWVWRGVLYHQVPGRKDIYINDPTMESLVVMPSLSKWIEFAWVGAASFDKKESLNGKPCLVYKKTNVNNPLKAWIDGSTFLPARFETATQVMTYEYLSPPSSLPPLSPDFEKTINGYIDRLKSMSVPRSPR